MVRILPMATAILSLSISGCVSPGQVNRLFTPGHIQQATGYNPASGKFKPGNNGHGHPGQGNGNGNGRGKH